MEISEQTIDIYQKPDLIALLPSFSRKVAIAVLLIGCVVIFGWIFDIQVLKSILPGLVSMKPNTAMGFILSGVSLWLWHFKNRKSARLSRRWSSRLGKQRGNFYPFSHLAAIAILKKGLAILVILIGLLTLIEYGANLNLGIDELLFKDTANAISTPYPGRMAPNTACTFVLLGSALLSLYKPRPNYYIAHLLTLVAFLIPFLGLLGYIYGNAYFYKAGPSYTAMALHTAVTFILLCFSILFTRPDKGLMAVIASNNAGGIMAQRLSPAVIIIPPAVGWLILLGYRSNVYTPEMGISLLGILNVVIFAILIWWNAKDLGMIDGQRHRAEKALKRTLEDLENRVEERTIQLRETNTQLQSEIAERQKSYNLLQAVIEGITDPIFAKDIHGCYVMINSICARNMGKKVEEIIGKNDRDLFTPEMAHQYIDNDRLIMTTGETQISEEDVPVMGNMRTFLSTKSVYRNAQGNIIGIVGIARDITERKQAEKALQQSEKREREKAQQLELALHELQQTQAQLIQTEKISSLGQLVAGVAHEINNPINFIYGNINYANQYTQNLINLLHLYQHHYPKPVPAIEEQIEAIELDFLREDLSKLFSSMKIGAERIREIVLSLRNFSRLDESEMKPVNIHEGIDSTLLILQHRFKAYSDHSSIQVIKEYGELPLVECYAGQLNQVFMNLLANAIDALEEQGKMNNCTIENPQILIRTEKINSDLVAIRIADNGFGVTEEIRRKLFDPFFTTKPVGKGTGLGLSISYQIVVEKHRGTLKCVSAPNQGAEFIIEIPIHQN